MAREKDGEVDQKETDQHEDGHNIDMHVGAGAEAALVFLLTEGKEERKQHRASLKPRHVPASLKNLANTE